MPASTPVPPALPISDDLAKARKIRALGWLLVVLGLALSGGMAIIASYLRDIVIHNDQPGSHSHWTGGPEFTRTTFELFGSVFIFGIVALLAGIFQIRTGRRSPWLIALVLLSVVAILYLGSQIMQTPVPTR